MNFDYMLMNGDCINIYIVHALKFFCITISNQLYNKVSLTIILVGI